MSSGHPRRDVQWLLLMGARAGALYPTLSASQAQYRHGFEQTHAHAHTTIGSAVFQIFRTLGWRNALPRIARGFPKRLPLSVLTAVREDGALEVVVHAEPETPMDTESLTLEFHFLHGALDAALGLMEAPFLPGEAQPHGRSCRYLFPPKT